MHEVDIVQIQQREEARKHAPTVMPQIVLDLEEPAPAPEQPKEISIDSRPFPNKISEDLWSEMIRVKKDRDILSTRTAYLVADLTERLRNESQATADAFLAGDLPMPELAEHYAKIQALTDQAIALYDKAREVDQYGAIHEPARPDPLPNRDANALQHQIRRLDDAIYKNKKKLRTGKPKNLSRVALWNEKIAMDEARRDDLKAQLKRLQYEARGQRTGEE